MKKTTLLFTLLFANALNGMEPEQGLIDLPKEIHFEIVKQAVESSDNLADMLKAINVANVLQGVRYDNLKNFTPLVHILADKFNEHLPIVAEQFGTDTSKQYLELSKKLVDAVIQLKTKTINEVNKIIHDLLKLGADANYNKGGCGRCNPLTRGVASGDVNTIKLLLDFGADPSFYKPPFTVPYAIQFLNVSHLHESKKSEKEEKMQLLEDAIKKQSMTKHKETL